MEDLERAATILLDHGIPKGEEDCHACSLTPFHMRVRAWLNAALAALSLTIDRALLLSLVKRVICLDASLLVQFAVESARELQLRGVVAAPAVPAVAKPMAKEELPSEGNKRKRVEETEVGDAYDTIAQLLRGLQTGFIMKPVDSDYNEATKEYMRVRNQMLRSIESSLGREDILEYMTRRMPADISSIAEDGKFAFTLVDDLASALRSPRARSLGLDQFVPTADVTTLYFKSLADQFRVTGDDVNIVQNDLDLLTPKFTKACQSSSTFEEYIGNIAFCTQLAALSSWQRLDVDNPFTSFYEEKLRVFLRQQVQLFLKGHSARGILALEGKLFVFDAVFRELASQYAVKVVSYWNMPREVAVGSSLNEYYARTWAELPTDSVTLERGVDSELLLQVKEFIRTNGQRVMVDFVVESLYGMAFLTAEEQKVVRGTGLRSLLEEFYRSVLPDSGSLLPPDAAAASSVPPSAPSSVPLPQEMTEVKRPEQTAVVGTYLLLVSRCFLFVLDPEEPVVQEDGNQLKMSLEHFHFDDFLPWLTDRIGRFFPYFLDQLADYLRTNGFTFWRSSEVEDAIASMQDETKPLTSSVASRMCQAFDYGLVARYVARQIAVSLPEKERAYMFATRQSPEEFAAERLSPFLEEVFKQIKPPMTNKEVAATIQNGTWRQLRRVYSADSLRQTLKRFTEGDYDLPFEVIERRIHKQQFSLTKAEVDMRPIFQLASIQRYLTTTPPNRYVQRAVAVNCIRQLMRLGPDRDSLLRYMLDEVPTRLWEFVWSSTANREAFLDQQEKMEKVVVRYFRSVFVQLLVRSSSSVYREGAEGAEVDLATPQWIWHATMASTNDFVKRLDLSPELPYLLFIGCEMCLTMEHRIFDFPRLHLALTQGPLLDDVCLSFMLDIPNRSALAEHVESDQVFQYAAQYVCPAYTFESDGPTNYYSLFVQLMATRFRSRPRFPTVQSFFEALGLVVGETTTEFDSFYDSDPEKSEYTREQFGQLVQAVKRAATRDPTDPKLLTIYYGGLDRLVAASPLSLIQTTQQVYSPGVLRTAEEESLLRQALTIYRGFSHAEALGWGQWVDQQTINDFVGTANMRVDIPTQFAVRNLVYEHCKSEVYRLPSWWERSLLNLAEKLQDPAMQALDDEDAAQALKVDSATVHMVRNTRLEYREGNFDDLRRLELALPSQRVRMGQLRNDIRNALTATSGVRVNPSLTTIYETRRITRDEIVDLVLHGKTWGATRSGPGWTEPANLIDEDAIRRAVVRDVTDRLWNNDFKEETRVLPNQILYTIKELFTRSGRPTTIEVVDEEVLRLVGRGLELHLTSPRALFEKLLMWSHAHDLIRSDRVDVHGLSLFDGFMALTAMQSSLEAAVPDLTAGLLQSAAQQVFFERPVERYDDPLRHVPSWKEKEYSVSVQRIEQSLLTHFEQDDPTTSAKYLRRILDDFRKKHDLTVDEFVDELERWYVIDDEYKRHATTDEQEVYARQWRTLLHAVVHFRKIEPPSGSKKPKADVLSNLRLFVRSSPLVDELEMAMTARPLAALDEAELNDLFLTENPGLTSQLFQLAGKTMFNGARARSIVAAHPYASSIVEPEHSLYDLTRAMYEVSVGATATATPRVQSLDLARLSKQEQTGVLIRWFRLKWGLSSDEFEVAASLLAECIRHREAEAKQRTERSDLPAFLDREVPPPPIALQDAGQLFSSDVRSWEKIITAKVSYSGWSSLAYQLMSLHGTQWEGVATLLGQPPTAAHTHLQPLSAITRTQIIPFLPLLRNSGLRVLDLSYSDLDDLSAVRGMPLLEYLSVERCSRLTVDSLKSVTDMPRLHTLCINRIFTQTPRMARTFRVQERGFMAHQKDDRWIRLSTEEGLEERIFSNSSIEQLATEDLFNYTDLEGNLALERMDGSLAVQLPLQKLPSLRTLIMRQVDLTDELLGGIMGLRLEELDMRECRGLGRNLPEGAHIALEEARKSNLTKTEEKMAAAREAAREQQTPLRSADQSILSSMMSEVTGSSDLPPPKRTRGTKQQGKKRQTKLVRQPATEMELSVNLRNAYDEGQRTVQFEFDESLYQYADALRHIQSSSRLPRLLRHGALRGSLRRLRLSDSDVSDLSTISSCQRLSDLELDRTTMDSNAYRPVHNLQLKRLSAVETRFNFGQRAYDPPISPEKYTEKEEKEDVVKIDRQRKFRDPNANLTVMRFNNLTTLVLAGCRKMNGKSLSFLGSEAWRLSILDLSNCALLDEDLEGFFRGWCSLV